MNTLVMLALAGAGLWWYGNQAGWFTGSTAPTTPAPSAATNTQVQNGQVSQIQGNSALAAQLGWAAPPAVGTTRNAYGQQYTFDGTNWNLSTSTWAINPGGPSCPAGMVQAGSGCNPIGVSGYGMGLRPARNYVRKSRFR